MFHHFLHEKDPSTDVEIGRNCLVRSTDFEYRVSPVASFIASVTQCGYRRTADGYRKKSLPRLEFTYSHSVLSQEITEIDAESLENLPYGLDNAWYQWVDLDGEGLSGILTEQGEGWFLQAQFKSFVHKEKRRGQGRGTQQDFQAWFGPTERIARQPSLAELGSGRQQFLDLVGDGQRDLVDFRPPTPGFFERAENESCESFIPFTSLPVVNWDDPNLKFVDLTGDGHADILVTEDEVFTWYPSLAEAGFGAGERVRQALEEELGPRLVFGDGTQSISVADMSGDGLNDLVRIRNGEVCYWPNLGYGRFGARVTMDDAPWFDGCATTICVAGRRRLRWPVEGVHWRRKT
jgi:hypothetical protein